MVADECSGWPSTTPHSPHQSKDRGNNVLAVDFTPQTEERCRGKLGSIIREYYREAAWRIAFSTAVPVTQR